MDTACFAYTDATSPTEQAKKKEIVTLLRKRGCPFDLQNAVTLGDYQEVKKLLDQPQMISQLEAQSEIDGQCVLHRATEKGYTHIVALLLSRGFVHF